MRRRRGEAGFTLIEVIIAIAVMALMMVVAWGSVVQTMNAKRQFERQQDRYREARSAMQRMAGDLESAYISQNEDTTVMDRRTFFEGDASGDVQGLKFTTFAHQRLYADANESDQTVISYYAASDRQNRSITNLMRRETKRLGFNEKPENIPGEADVLFSNIGKLKLSYFDVKDNDWKDTWNSHGTETTANRLPDRVRIEMTFPDENGKDVTLTTQVKIVLQEMVQGYAR